MQKKPEKIINQRDQTIRRTHRTEEEEERRRSSTLKNNRNRNIFRKFQTKSNSIIIVNFFV